jgi:ATP-dependent DNA helicase RecG
MKEHQNLEYKQSWRDEYLKWICGYANAEGGILVVGKNDKGKVIGLDNAQKLLEDIPNKVRDILGILVDVNLKSNEKGEYLEIIVEPYPYPVSYKGQYHYRSGSTKQELKGAALDRFLLKKQGKHWDGVPVPYVKTDNLNNTVIDSFRKRALKSKRLSSELLKESNSLLLDKLHLFEGDYLKRAAILLFYPDPERYITGAFIKIGYFLSNADLLYHDEIHGDLFVQVDKVLDLLLTKYMKALISYEGIQRVETFPVPEEALRETLLNAVIHKDYSSATPIQISVYEDKILFWNPGTLPEGWTVESLTRKHASQPFNPDVANAFFRAGMIEAWGRGVEKVFEACRKATIKEPNLRYEHTGLWVEFDFAARKTIQKNGVATLEKEDATQKTTQKTTRKQQEIVSIIKENPNVSQRTISEMLGDISPDGVKYHLRKMRQSGQIRRVGPDKGGYWELLK